MKQAFITLLILSFFISSYSQIIVRGKLLDSKTNLAVEGATITISPANVSASTDETGRFSFKDKFDTGSTVTISCIGYSRQVCKVSDLAKNHSILITQKQISLTDVVVVASSGNQYRPISKSDIARLNKAKAALRRAENADRHK